jgi:hypothetical protein
VRRVTQSAFVQAAVERATREMSSFKRIFEEGIMWQLQRAPLDDAVEIPGSDPPVFVLETAAWRAEGIPRMSIGFIRAPHGIEVVSLTLRKDPRRIP